jgi:predicted DNA-binding transcriptional regulator YafY
VHSGPPERVEIEFDPSLADYVTAREWHRSQAIDRDADGRIRMTLQVSIDQALRSWILSFGPSARVSFPDRLAKEIAEQFEQARARYR